MSELPTRRAVLRSSVGLATAGVLGPIAMDGARADTDGARATEPTEYIPRTTEEIRAAFADVPYDEDPSDLSRSVAPMRFPEPVIPDDGSVPDPPTHVTVQLEPPEWALATAYHKARYVKEEGGEPSKSTVHDKLLEIAYAWEEWVLPDGSDAVEAILEAVEEDTDG